MIEWSEENIRRYSRQILLPEIGVEGQERICEGRVLIVGAGGLGSPVAFYLAAAGVGTIGIVDADTVDLSNLSRQIIHFTENTGEEKIRSATEKIRRINPNVHTVPHTCFLDENNVLSLIADYDFIVDCTDNFQAKYLINDACVLSRKAFSIAGVLRFSVQVMTSVPGTACYRCLFPDMPSADDAPTCAEAGVLGSVVGIAGCIQATETLKYLTGTGNLLTDRLLTVNALTMEFRILQTECDAGCPVCGKHPSIRQPRAEYRPVCPTNLENRMT